MCVFIIFVLYRIWVYAHVVLPPYLLLSNWFLNTCTLPAPTTPECDAALYYRTIIHHTLCCYSPTCQLPSDGCSRGTTIICWKSVPSSGTYCACPPTVRTLRHNCCCCFCCSVTELQGMLMRISYYFSIISKKLLIRCTLLDKCKLREKLPFHLAKTIKVKEILAILHDILAENGRRANRQGGWADGKVIDGYYFAKFNMPLLMQTSAFELKPPILMKN